MKRILCYGDSNTWGYIPGTARRYPADVRWTGIMAKELGEDYEVVEAGLNGRTTVYDDPFGPYLNGLEFLPMVLMQSAPLDLIIISLGTNDLKFVNAVNVGRGIGRLIDQCQKANTAFVSPAKVLNDGAKILVISPIAVSPRYAEINPYTSLRPDAVEESLKFPSIVKHFADTYHVEYIDASAVACPSDVDGVHMEPESHAALAKVVTEKVREMLG